VKAPHGAEAIEGRHPGRRGEIGIGAATGLQPGERDSSSLPAASTSAIRASV
jgi:hypothetical protein